MYDNNLLSQPCSINALSQHMIEQNYDIIYYFIVIIIVYL